MKIKKNDQAHSTTFEAIHKGELFIYEDSVLIKTEETSHYGELYNAVDLETGDYYTFSGFDRVTRPSSFEFVVNY
jgi:hypothetical protein